MNLYIKFNGKAKGAGIVGEFTREVLGWNALILENKSGFDPHKTEIHFANPGDRIEDPRIILPMSAERLETIFYSWKKDTKAQELAISLNMTQANIQKFKEHNETPPHYDKDEYLLFIL